MNEITTKAEVWTSKKVLAKTCNVTVDTIGRIASKIIQKDFANDSTIVRKIVSNGKTRNVYYSDELCKAIQIQLKRNSINAGGQKTKNSIIKADNIGDMAIGFVFTKGTIEQQKDMIAFLQEKVTQQELLQNSQDKVKQLEHALEYDKVKDWKTWSHLKKQIEYKGNFQKLVTSIPLIEDKDYSRKVMGNDKYPTTLISLDGEEKIIDYKENVLDEE